MASLFRSEAMSKCLLYLETDAAYNCMSSLGELGLVQFADLNTEVLLQSRRFTQDLRRCDEMERKLVFFEKLMVEERMEMGNDDMGGVEAPSSSEMPKMETEFEAQEIQLLEMNNNLGRSKNTRSSLIEFKHVLQHLDLVFEENLTERNQSAEQQDVGKLGFTAAVIAREKLFYLERMLWFACRGNALIKFQDIESDEQEKKIDDIPKSVLYIFYQGDQLRNRVAKILEAYHAQVYQAPLTLEESRSQLVDVESRIKDLNEIIGGASSYRSHKLLEISRHLPQWVVQTRKIKAIFHGLNMLQDRKGHKYLVGECWCPTLHLTSIRTALFDATQRSGVDPSAAILNVIEAGHENPPTYHVTNKFTKVFQGIVDSYGIASYQEVNPAPFIIISFPFLFSLMFGDAGHGVLVFLIALWMVLSERKYMNQKTDNEIWKIFFGGRYIILLMGAFSIYSGLMYNDVFAKPVNIFGSSWYPNPNKYTLRHLAEHHSILMNPSNSSYNDYRGYPYAFGMDPIWLISHNKITWLNSFKMKVSIVFGIFQMFFGVTLSFFNHRFFRRPLDIFCQFLPELIFLTCMFGYLVVLIIYKWLAFNASNSSCAPSLLINLISTFLYNYPDEPCSPTNFYPNQKEFQTFLLLLVVVCIPWLLLPKPLILRHLNKKKMLKIGSSASPHQIEAGGGIELSPSSSIDEGNHLKDSHSNHDHEQFDFGDVMIHQCIHTIEYCLGCISHTASYLRLWALSLAHAELSEVLWMMVMRQGFSLLKSEGATPSGNCIVLFIIWTPWAFLSVAILLLMEGLSAFLHTLRLHWVEFQSKFYKGEGYKFEPFSFRKILKKRDE